MTKAKRKIRFRQVIVRGNQYGQQYGRYDEYQVVENRKIIGRYDLLKHAKKAYPDAEPDASCN